ncbi:MAG: hypothetical protein EOP83_10780 [Verrucomicrobiaceae bacterium]|nr:MAG: hypothetical protein EOP83_10780 [Verrucomicrobiaceae bacterium]
MNEDFEPEYPFPHEVEIREFSNKREAKLWCIEHFGKNLRYRDRNDQKMQSITTMWQSPLGGMVYRFRNPDHAFEFKMRWG